MPPSGANCLVWLMGAERGGIEAAKFPRPFINKAVELRRL